MQMNQKAKMVVVAAFGIDLACGINYIWSITSKELVREYNWTSTEAALPYTLVAMIATTWGIFAGRLGDRFQPRICALIGATFLGAGLFLSSFQTSAKMMLLTYGVCVGLGISFCTANSSPTAIKWWPIEKKGLISGICFSAYALTSLYISPMVNRLLDSRGIATVFQFLGILIFCQITFFALFLFKPKGDRVPAATGAGVPTEMAAVPLDGATWRQMISTKEFFKLYVLFAFGASAGLMVISNIATVAAEQAGWEDGFWLVIFLAVANAVGRLSCGMISDKIGINNMYRLILGAQAVNMLLFHFYTTKPLLTMGAAIEGFCFGGVIAVSSATTAGLFGRRNLGVNWGIVNTAYGMGAFLGPFMAGQIFDLTGSYRNSFLVAAVFLLIALGVANTIGKGKNPRSPFSELGAA